MIVKKRNRQRQRKRVERIIWAPGWLIESEDRSGRPIWYSASSGWSRDHKQALRFAREQDASDFFQAYLDGGGQSGWVRSLQNRTKR